MARIPLVLGAYSARSIIANAQRAVNLYPEKNPPDSPVPFTHYPAPGLELLATPSPAGAARCLYYANSGDLYYVAGNTVYWVDTSWGLNVVGTIGTSGGMCYMADNGTTAVLIDGSASGYEINLSTRTMTTINPVDNAPDPAAGTYAFYGATRIDALDGYLLLNRPQTRDFYSTYLNDIVFDSLYFGNKNGYSDKLVTLIVCMRQIWLIGERTTEIWYNEGAADFPFARMPGPFIQHGCVAPYSVAQMDGSVYWLSQDQNGQAILVRGQGYQVKQASNRALETEWASYETVADAEAFAFQQNGHSFYQINFPTAGKSWRYDGIIGDPDASWHEVVYIDNNGREGRHRAAVAAFAYGRNVAGDYQNGKLYEISSDVYTDNGQPMVWRRGFPHMVDDGNRIIYTQFIADIQAGSAEGFPVSDPPVIWLRWSDTRGRTWGTPIRQSWGATGEYYTMVTWNRLGMARDRVFELYGTIPGKFGLNGAFVDFQKAAT